MKTSELKEKTKAELDNLLKEKKEALAKFRFETAGAKTKNTKEAREIKKDIARVLTLMNKK